VVPARTSIRCRACPTNVDAQRLTRLHCITARESTAGQAALGPSWRAASKQAERLAGTRTYGPELGGRFVERANMATEDSGQPLVRYRPAPRLQ
jgi:hypothetical protein